MNQKPDGLNEPSWNLTSEYPAFDSENFQKDYEELNRSIEILGSKTAEFNIDAVSNLLLIRLKAVELIHYLFSFARGSLSIDSSNESAKSWSSKLMKVLTQLNSACVNLDEFLSSAEDKTIQKIAAMNPAWSFYIQNLRSERSIRLSNETEKMMNLLSADGFRSWDQMYTQLASTLKVNLSADQTVGFSKAESLLESPDSSIRKEAYLAINKAWKGQELIAASVINALAGWRIEIAKKRSEKAPYTYLSDSLNRNRIQKTSIDALFAAIDNQSVGRNAAKYCASIFGKSKLDIWDLFAPFPKPDSKPIPFNEAMDLVTNAFRQISPEMADFARMMLFENRIEARTFDGKESGAYCTGITNAKLPRIFLNYSGTLHSIRMLAHELGHAYHSWCMKDLSIIEQDYPLVLAETASLLAETALIDYVRLNGLSKEQENEVKYFNAASAHLYLLNIPVRFDFETAFYDKRKDGQVNAAALSQLMNDAWLKRYGDTTHGTNEMFWASKKHFHMSKASFYNYPYVFGYLFSLGVYAKRAELKGDFHSSYVRLLRDTGTMKPEDLAMKHLGVDLNQTSFWKSALDIVQKQF